MYPLPLTQAVNPQSCSCRRIAFLTKLLLQSGQQHQAQPSPVDSVAAVVFCTVKCWQCILGLV